MPRDDQSAGQQHDASKKPKEGNKPSEKQHDKKSQDYTTKMWQKIEGAVTKDKISGIKKEVEHKGPGQHGESGQHKQPDQQHPHSNVEGQQHKRHRHRHRGNRHGGPQGQLNTGEKMQKPQVNIPKPQVNIPEPVQFDEDRDDDVPHVEQAEPVPPAPPVEPINPFAFPTSSYEPKEKVKKEKIYKEKEEKKENIFTPKIEADSDVIPINPFAISDPAKPLDDRALDEKPLDTIGKVAKPESAYYEDSATAEEQGEAQETTVDVSNERRNEEEEQSEPARKEVIDVPVEEVKESKIEPVFPENIDKQDGQNLQNGESKEDFWNVLQQAGISKKKALAILVVFGVILIVGLFLAFGGYKIFWGGGENKKESRNVETVEQVDKVETEIPENLLNEGEPYDIISSYIFGLEFVPGITPIKAEPISILGDFVGIEAGLIFGKVDDFKVEQFVQYVQLLEKINNIYNVDIYSLLDMAVDRREALDTYLKETDALISGGMTALATIDADLERIDIQYDDMIEQANQYETAFFGYLRNYYGQTAYETLQYFVDSSNEAARIKAQYSAENTLKTMFINSLNLMRPRYRDAVANTEALIKGIRVFDVPKSNIDAIIPIN